MKVMFNLIGEQPIPNLLPVLYLKPDKSIFLYTDKTEKIAKNLKEMVTNSNILKIYPYDFNRTYSELKKLFTENDEIIANVTGGTKIMSLSLFQLALANNSEIIYYISEKNTSLLYKFRLNDNNELDLTTVELPELITAEQYIKAHIRYFDFRKQEKNRGTDFENLICDTLRENNFEVLQNIAPRKERQQLEIDAVIRLKGTNNVGIAEIKVGDLKGEGPKKGIEQLALASQREYLGTYTKRFLITSRKLKKEIRELAKVHNIIVIDGIEQNRYNDELTDESKRKLIEKLKEKLS